MKLVIAVPRPLSGVIRRLLSLFAAPKPFCAALETISPPSVSNCTMTLCITMMPMARTENCNPSGMPCKVTARNARLVICQSSLWNRSSGYFTKR